MAENVSPGTDKQIIGVSGDFPLAVVIALGVPEVLQSLQRVMPNAGPDDLVRLDVYFEVTTADRPAVVTSLYHNSMSCALDWQHMLKDQHPLGMIPDGAAIRLADYMVATGAAKYWPRGRRKKAPTIGSMS